MQKGLGVAGYPWLTPVIPATQEDLKAAWANSLLDPILEKTHHKKGLVEWLKCKPWVQIPVQEKKKTGDVAQVLECLLNKHKELSSNPVP
jgi:hypothetical protein